MAGREPRLDRDKIVLTALELLDEVGLDALTTRALAARLGVQQPALYWHFKNKQELVDAMAEAMLDAARWPERPASDADVEDWLAARADSFRQALLARRDGARVHAGTRPAPRRLPAIEAQVQALTAVGLSPADAARGALALSRYTLGWVIEEQAGQGRSARKGVEASQTTFPALGAARQVLDETDPDFDFDFGVRAMLRGLLRP
jgi:TetR/AcrR family transcriptional regulator, tetracycline repressor protein